MQMVIDVQKQDAGKEGEGKQKRSLVIYQNLRE